MESALAVILTSRATPHRLAVLASTHIFDIHAVMPPNPFELAVYDP
jgi:hypothetical protein